MSKSRPFSIYLLKEGFDATNSLKEGHGLETVTATHLPKGAILHVLDNRPSPPWWRNYFGISKDLHQVTKGAVIFLPVDDRCFALCFGHVYHHLNDGSYEYDFGLRVTLNCVDPGELKSTDVVEPGSSRRRRTQLPAAADLTYFDFDRDSSIIKTLVGNIKDEYLPYFTHATGSSNLRIDSVLEPGRLKELCGKLLTLYQSDQYRLAFPGIHNIEPVRDPQKITQLNFELMEAFQDKKEELYLTVPDILNYNEGLFVSFSGAGESLNYGDLSTYDYYEYLESKGVDLARVTEKALKAHSMNLIDENGKIKESFSIFKCITVDVELSGQAQTYHLCDGNWYKVEKSYVARMQAFLDPLYEDRVMPTYNHRTEGAYNRGVAEADGRFICLDETNISPHGQTTIEPCDLYMVEDGKAILHHVKVSTRSSLLSHLFNQGINSIELVESEEHARRKLAALITERIGLNDEATYLAPIAKSAFKVVYAIVTRKEKINRSANLPLFSRISLMRSIKALKLMRVPATFCFVEDRSEKQAGQRKKRKRRGRPANGEVLGRPEAVQTAPPS